MKIYFDGIFYNQSGIGRYYESLLRALSTKSLSIYTTVNINYRNDFENKFSRFGNINPVFVDYNQFDINNFVDQYFLLNKFKNSVDVFFFPHINLQFIPPKNSILTIHDFRPFTDYWDRSIYKKYFIQFLYLRAMHLSQQVVCISQQTQIALFKLSSRVFNKSRCIYEFIDDKFLIPSQAGSLIDSKYILFVGTRKKHKNIIFALKNFALIKDSIPHLFVLAGKRDLNVAFDEIDDFIFQHSLENRVIQFTSPSDDEIVSLYQHADLFVFPSLFEGFGLPPLEAVACGCPAILSDIPIFREIFGDTGLYFSPYSEGDLSELMMRLLMDENARCDLLVKQKVRLKLFDQDKIVTSYIELFESVAR